jgi:hypothetical protein
MAKHASRLQKAARLRADGLMKFRLASAYQP